MDETGGILVGILKVVAWNVMNPGDVYMSVRNSIQSGETALRGTNNTALASGALELWTTYDRERF